MSDANTNDQNPSPGPERAQQYIFARLNGLQLIVAALIKTHTDLPAFINALEQTRFVAETEHLFTGVGNEVMGLYSQEIDDALGLARDLLQTPAANPPDR